jgi:hypothetical protein
MDANAPISQIMQTLTTSEKESPVMTVWPGIGSMTAGRWVGCVAGNRLGTGFFTLGKLWALATIPVSLVVYFWRLMPGFCRRYALTNQRVIVRVGLTAKEGPSIGLDQFDAIGISVLPGQEWLHAGDLMFNRDGKEVFRLSGVSRPEGFRRACLKAQNALLRGREALQQSAAEAAPAN